MSTTSEPKRLVIFSGGQDSTTCLYYSLAQSPAGAAGVRALSINYGQKHLVELASAVAVTDLAGVEHETVDLPIGALRSTSPLVDHAREVEQYPDEASLPGGVEDTFVPFRNLLFLVVAANHALHHGCDRIMIGVSQEDFGGYPDCREPFLVAAQVALNEAIGGREVMIEAPLLSRSKRETVELAAALPGCMDALALSHTCYRGDYPPCGKCHACILRAKGFSEAGVPDPIFRMVERAAPTSAEELADLDGGRKS